MGISNRTYTDTFISRLKTYDYSISNKMQGRYCIGKRYSRHSKKHKIEVRKVFQINNSIGLVGTGYEEQIIELIEQLQKYLGDEEFPSEPTLRNRINEALTNIHAIKNVIGSNRSGYQHTHLLFHPNALIGAKLKNGLYCLYEIDFGPWGDKGVYMAGLAPVNDYKAIGSGSQFATFVIKQQSRIHQLDKLDINSGIAAYTIGEVKDIELNSGRNTNLAIIDKKDYRDVLPNELLEYYQKMIDNTLSLLSQYCSNRENFKKEIERIFSID